MLSCPCSPEGLTAVRFDGGVVMLRCGLHDQQRWLVHGRPTLRADVLPVLRNLFADRRGEPRRTHPAPKPVKVVRRASPAYAAVPAGAGDDERLTVLLHARGLSGSWAVA